MKRDLITLEDLSRSEIEHIFDVCKAIKQNKGLKSNKLEGKSIGLLFQKPSNRTRVSFEVGIWQLGGTCLYLGPDEINLGKRESISDVAKTLSRYLHGIVARTHTHEDIVELSRQATIPVINGLSDLSHPCQALTDLFSIREKFGHLNDLTVAYVGDGNNVCHSLMEACSKLGVNLNIATPVGYEPSIVVINQAKMYAQESKAQINLSHSPQEAVGGVQVIYADTWISMGQEAETAERLKLFEGFQVNNELVKLADKNFIFMHCLPAHRGQEVTDEVIDGKHSIIFDQAENRLHVQKAILTFLFNPIHKLTVGDDRDRLLH